MTVYAVDDVADIGRRLRALQGETPASAAPSFTNAPGAPPIPVSKPAQDDDDPFGYAWEDF